MIRLWFVVSGILGLSAMLAVSGPAWAHVVVSPEVVSAGDYETLTVSVPTEKEIPTTNIRVVVPEGFLLSGVQPVAGWEHTFQEDGAVVRAVTFTGGQIRPREFQQFLLQAQAPEQPGQYPWKAIQTYEDGSVVEWTGPPDSEEPASVIEVVSGGSEHPQSSPQPSEASASREKAAGGEAKVLAETGGTNLAVYAGLGCVGVVLSALLAQRLLG
jgi:uncharacterized protein YcnI